MSKVFMRKEHIALWTWVSEDEHRRTNQWPGWARNGGTYNTEHDCFACDYSPKCAEEHEPTDTCPLVHVSDGGFCLGGLPWECLHAVGEKHRKLALEIANLPVREGVITNEEDL